MGERGRDELLPEEENASLSMWILFIDGSEAYSHECLSLCSEMCVRLKLYILWK